MIFREKKSCCAQAEVGPRLRGHGMFFSQGPNSLPQQGRKFRWGGRPGGTACFFSQPVGWTLAGPAWLADGGPWERKASWLRGAWHDLFSRCAKKNPAMPPLRPRLSSDGMACFLFRRPGQISVTKAGNLAVRKKHACAK